MAFKDKFKEFTDTLAAKSSEVAQKAKDMADVASLNSQIKTEKEAINNAYLSIGETVYQEQKDSENSPFDDQIQSIKRRLAKIAELEKSISEIKGTKKCPFCGETIGILAEICPKCKQELPEEEIVAVERVCPACGEPVAEDDTVCVKCGRNL